MTQVRLEPAIPRSRVKHSIVLPRSYDYVFVHLCRSTIQLDSANSDEIPIFATSRLSLQCMKCLDRKIKFLIQPIKYKAIYNQYNGKIREITFKQ